jgi:hypothetical protein
MGPVYPSCPARAVHITTVDHLLRSPSFLVSPFWSSIIGTQCLQPMGGCAPTVARERTQQEIIKQCETPHFGC